MPSRNLLETVEYFLRERDIKNALEISEQALETMALHVDYKVSDILMYHRDAVDGDEMWYTLSKICLLQKDYERCMECVCNIKDDSILFDNANNFYGHSILFHMLESNRREIREKVMNIKDRASLSKVGYFIENRLYEGFLRHPCLLGKVAPVDPCRL